MELHEEIYRAKELMNLIVEEPQEPETPISDFFSFKGTKKPMGAEGIETRLIKELLILMKTIWSNESGFKDAATEMESKMKVSRKNREPLRKGLMMAQSTCTKDPNFNEKRYPGFCMSIQEVLISDSDNRFSMSYGFA